MLGRNQPSVAQDYARSRSNARHKDAWDNQVLSFAPLLGKTGDRLRDFGRIKLDPPFVNMGPENWVRSDDPRFPGDVLEFNGSDNHIDLNGFIQTDTSRSFVFWIKRENQNYLIDYSGSRMIIGFGANATANNLSFFDGAWRSLGLWPASEWHHGALTLNAGTSTAIGYIDAVVLGTSSYTSITLNNENCNLCISVDGISNPLQCQLADFRLYDGVLSPREVRDDLLVTLRQFRVEKSVTRRLAAPAVAALPLGTLALTGVGR